MTIRERITRRLKPKVKQFGFTKNVFKSVAAKLADKLEDIDENASEDDINAKIDEAIEDSLPFLALIQSSANELHSEWKKGLQKDETNEEDEEEEESTESNRKNRPDKTSRTKKDDEPAWFKKFREEQEAKFEALKGEKIAETRRSRLEKLLKDSGSFGNRTLKSFSKMKFESDDDFDEFLSDVEADLKVYNQERADAGLHGAGNPPGGKNDSKQSPKEEGFTDAQIDVIMANL